MIIDNPPIANPKYSAILWCLLAICMIVTRAHGFSGTVAAVHSGETLAVVTEEGRRTIRLYGIDAPASGQQGANAAKRYLRGLAMAHPVEVEVIAMDVFGQTVAVVKRVQKESSINAAIVANGWAWVNPKTCQADVCATWQRLQRQAQKYRLGIWSGYDLTPPWEFRAQQRR